MIPHDYPASPLEKRIADLLDCGIETVERLIEYGVPDPRKVCRTSGVLSVDRSGHVTLDPEGVQRTPKGDTLEERVCEMLMMGKPITLDNLRAACKDRPIYKGKNDGFSAPELIDPWLMERQTLHTCANQCKRKYYWYLK